MKQNSSCYDIIPEFTWNTQLHLITVWNKNERFSLFALALMLTICQNICRQIANSVAYTFKIQLENFNDSSCTTVLVQSDVNQNGMPLPQYYLQLASQMPNNHAFTCSVDRCVWTATGIMTKIFMCKQQSVTKY